ncbi:MAG: Cys-tRNA(Pro) deacylase [Propionibacteriaceae bacterium]|jgi:Cys-tRNA(Pro)/Cys-tRNA(Cys) deacylase|nr:Cys-tRNA(Pro) deacylase [Propionibacteriaceae bacterium]
MATGTPATLALAAAGVEFTLHRYQHDPASTDFGHEAAAGLRVDEMQIFKTLVVDIGVSKPQLCVGVVPVAGMLDLKAIAAVLGAKRAVLADPKAAAASSGYIVGGISPIAQKNKLPTVIDETAQLFDTIFVSAGKRGLQVELSPANLAEITTARFADIAR